MATSPPKPRHKCFLSALLDLLVSRIPTQSGTILEFGCTPEWFFSLKMP